MSNNASDEGPACIVRRLRKTEGEIPEDSCTRAGGMTAGEPSLIAMSRSGLPFEGRQL